MQITMDMVQTGEELFSGFDRQCADDDHSGFYIGAQKSYCLVIEHPAC
jgi:hypothetical protein